MSQKLRTVNSSNIDDRTHGELLLAFHKLDQVKPDAKNAVQAIELQSKISRELTDRGWTLDEEEEDWFLPVIS